MKVYPIPGAFLQTVPAVEHECDDPFCVDSGAFSTKRPPPIEAPAVELTASEEAPATE